MPCNMTARLTQAPWMGKCGQSEAVCLPAGEATHGAKMVYDLRPDGTRQYALALVLAIYTLPNTSEVWFEHKYFLSRGDLAERPRWSSFLQVRGVVVLPPGS